MNQTLNTKIVLRNDSTSKWNAAVEAAGEEGLVLLKGETAWEFTEKGPKMKVGDGTTRWENLEYFGGEEAKTFQVGSLDEITETDLAVGDTAIVKVAINASEEDEEKIKYSYTGYVWNGSDWAAMDGNYSASNVFLSNNITLAGSFTSVGNYSKGKTINAGTSLESILSGMLQQELYPNANDKPNASISVSGGNGEVGSEYTVPTATLKIDDVGSYQYGDTATGITFAIGSVKLAEGADPATATNTKTNDSVMSKGNTITLKASGDKALYTDTGKTYTFSGTASYEKGTKVPVTNLNNPYPSAQIPAGSVTIDDKSATFSGWRYIFGGGTTAATIDSTAIRALAKDHKSNETVPTTNGGTGFKFSAAKGATKVIFAYPADWTTKTPKFEIFTMAWGGTEGFVKSTVQVADYRGGTNGLKDYTVYTYTPAGPLSADNTEYCVYFA